MNNYEMALIRLKSQEKSLTRKGPEVTKAYNQNIEDYARKDYVKKVCQTEERDQWFLPNFPVVRDQNSYCV